MELATIFSVAYHFEVPIGAIMLVSDMPLQRKGIKDRKKQEEVFSNHMNTHLDMGIDAVKSLNANWDKVETRLASEW